MYTIFLQAAKEAAIRTIHYINFFGVCQAQFRLRLSLLQEKSSAFNFLSHGKAFIYRHWCGHMRQQKAQVALTLWRLLPNTMKMIIFEVSIILNRSAQACSYDVGTIL